MARVALPNFSKGEIGPDLYGRIDTQQYSSALKTARNFVVQKYGGVTFRPGTRMVGKVDDPEQATRLLEFQFSINQSYVLVMGQGTMRPVALGGFVLEQNTKITDVTKGATTALEIPYHGYSVGDRIYLSGIVGIEDLNGQFATVLTAPDANNITVDIDSSAMDGAFVSSDGTENVAPPAPPPTPPAVETPIEEPPDPDVGGGGGYDYEWYRNGYFYY